jgi:hypothetical protein
MNDSMARVARHFVAVLLVGLSLAVSKATSAQSLAEVAALNAQVEELYRQGRYSEATPLAQRVLRIREAASVQIILMSERRSTISRFCTKNKGSTATPNHCSSEPWQ